MAAADGDFFNRAIFVMEEIVCRMFAELSHTPHRRDEAMLGAFIRPRI